MRNADAPMVRRTTRLEWGVKIPLRDGVSLNATVYLPRSDAPNHPCIVTVTPYVSQLWHSFAVYFADRGFPFVAVDCRGRGNSEGVFRPFTHEAGDGFDVVEWVASQPYCNGKVAMWGGSYGGFNQWAAASRRPPHLAAIVPVAAVYPAHDFPMRSNVPYPYIMQWLMFVAGRTSQEKLFFELPQFWNATLKEWFESGRPFTELDQFLGIPTEIFQEWVSHPRLSSYWDGYSPTPQERAGINIPVLTITGIYDSAQPGALRHHREHLAASPEARHSHQLVIGPWHHAGTRVPASEFAGIKVGPSSLLDLQKLHVDWYTWTLCGGPKPEFFKKPVAYYVLGAETWRYADTLEEVTSEWKPFYLDSVGDASRVFGGGVLGEKLGAGNVDSYLYDPRDLSVAELEATSRAPLCLRPTFHTDDLSDQTVILASDGKHLVYQTEAFTKELEIAGVFKLSVWVSIDTPDTDLHAAVYAIDSSGSSILLTEDWMRVRFRQSLREPMLVTTTKPQRYDFSGFTFTSIRMGRWSRLRLVIGPLDSMYCQKNFNSGGVVAEETASDARPVTVALFHDSEHPSALYVPIGQHDATNCNPALDSAWESSVAAATP